MILQINLKRLLDLTLLFYHLVPVTVWSGLLIIFFLDQN